MLRDVNRKKLTVLKFTDFKKKRVLILNLNFIYKIIKKIIYFSN